MPADKLILVTGATGYVGGRLLLRLVEDGWRVRCLARQPERLSSRVPAGVEVVPGDVLDAVGAGNGATHRHQRRAGLLARGADG